MIEVSLSFAFSTSNNKAGYEAFIARLMLASDFGAKTILVVSHVKNDFVTNDPILQRYLDRVRELFLLFNHVELKHVPRVENAQADFMSKVASLKKSRNLQSIIQENMKKSSVDLSPTSVVEVATVVEIANWMQPIKDYIELGVEPADLEEASAVRRRSTSYSIIDG